MGFVHEHIVLPLSDLVKGEQVHKYLRLLRQAEQWDETEIKAYQSRKIKELVAHVAKEVPFYKDWFDKNGVDPQSIQSVGALRQLPIVNKAMMRREGIGRFAAPLGNLSIIMNQSYPIRLIWQLNCVLGIKLATVWEIDT